MYLILSALFLMMYFIPELVNETVFSESFDGKMKVAILFVLFILIQNVYLTLNQKYSSKYCHLAGLVSVEKI